MDEFIRRVSETLAKNLQDRLGTVPESLKDLFDLTKKSKVEKYCRNLIITKNDLASLVFAADTLGYTHEIKTFQYVPNQLRISHEELGALSGDTGSSLSRDGRKVLNKIKGTFEQRRYSVAHLFLKDPRWHILYFDFRDMEDRYPNHWKGGSHIHFVNYLWANLSMQEVWESLAGRSNKSYGLHIRYVDETSEPNE